MCRRDSRRLPGPAYDLLSTIVRTRAIGRLVCHPRPLTDGEIGPARCFEHVRAVTQRLEQVAVRARPGIRLAAKSARDQRVMRCVVGADESRAALPSVGSRFDVRLRKCLSSASSRQIGYGLSGSEPLRLSPPRSPWPKSSPRIQTERRPPARARDKLAAVLPQVLPTVAGKADHQQPRRRCDCCCGDDDESRRDAGLNGDHFRASVGHRKADVDERYASEIDGVYSRRFEPPQGERRPQEVVDFFGDKCCWLPVERRVPEL